MISSKTDKDVLVPWISLLSTFLILWVLEIYNNGILAFSYQHLNIFIFNSYRGLSPRKPRIHYDRREELVQCFAFSNLLLSNSLRTCQKYLGSDQIGFIEVSKLLFQQIYLLNSGTPAAQFWEGGELFA